MRYELVIFLCGFLCGVRKQDRWFLWSPVLPLHFRSPLFLWSPLFLQGLYWPTAISSWIHGDSSLHTGCSRPSSTPMSLPEWHHFPYPTFSIISSHGFHLHSSPLKLGILLHICSIGLVIIIRDDTLTYHDSFLHRGQLLGPSTSYIHLTFNHLIPWFSDLSLVYQLYSNFSSFLCPNWPHKGSSDYSSVSSHGSFSLHLPSLLIWTEFCFSIFISFSTPALKLCSGLFCFVCLFFYQDCRVEHPQTHALHIAPTWPVVSLSALGHLPFLFLLADTELNSSLVSNALLPIQPF